MAAVVTMVDEFLQATHHEVLEVPTTRRMSPGHQRCQWGSGAVGGDDILHFLSCPLLGDAIRSQGVAPLVWSGTAHLMLITLQLPLAETDPLRVVVWAYLSYMLFTGARHAAAPWGPGFFPRSCAGTGMVASQGICPLPRVVGARGLSTLLRSHLGRAPSRHGRAPLWLVADGGRSVQ